MEVKRQKEPKRCGNRVKARSTNQNKEFYWSDPNEMFLMDLKYLLIEPRNAYHSNILNSLLGV